MKLRSKPAGKLSRKTGEESRARRRPRASTAEIITNSDDATVVPGKWKTHYNELLRLRRTLARRKEHLVTAAKEEKPTFSLHMADAGTDTFDRDFALSMLSSDQNALYEIEQALTRIRSGMYGKCELTGEAIAPERLKAIPWTRYSTRAERDLEKRGRTEKTKLGALKSVRKEDSSANEAEETEV